MPVCMCRTLQRMCAPVEERLPTLLTLCPSPRYTGAFVMILDTTAEAASSVKWSKQWYDATNYPRGSGMSGADADASGNVVVSGTQCVEGTEDETDRYGRPTCSCRCPTASLCQRGPAGLRGRTRRRGAAASRDPR